MNFTPLQIVEVFKKSGLNKSELARKMKSDISNVSKQLKKMENGESLTTKTIEKFAKALNLHKE